MLGEEKNTFSVRDDNDDFSDIYYVSFNNLLSLTLLFD